MKQILATLISLLSIIPLYANNKIYHKGWIDFNKNGRMDIFENPKASIEDRVKDLISQMTLEEKTCQMATLYGSGRVLKDAGPTAAWADSIWKDGIGNIDEQANGLGSFHSRISYPYRVSINNRQNIQRWFVENTRLGIPVDFTNEGIRGLCHDRATLFPAESGLGATWDRSLINEVGKATAVEAKALGYTNIYSPVLDCARDPRWGRTVESYGEDPYLVGELGLQQVRGIQAEGIVSTLKHFAAYSIPVGGRDGATRTNPNISFREMHTLLLEPFRKCIKDGGAMGVMASYNDYDGEPIIASHFFLTDVLRKQYGFRGYVVSDSRAVEFVWEKHHVANNAVEGISQVVNAGLNIRTDFTSPSDFILPLRSAVSQGLVSEATIDERVADILRVKMQLGLFDNPYKGDVGKADQVVHSAQHQALSLRAARESIVLLKNEDNLLPLSKHIGRLAVIGPNADERALLGSRYGPANAPIISVYQGIKEALPNTDVLYAKGCDIIDKHFPQSELYKVPLDTEEHSLMDSAVAVARQADAVVMVLGGNNKTVGEEYSRTSLLLPGRQEHLLEELAATGKPLVLVLLDGRASSICWANEHIKAIVHGWFPGEFTGKAIADVLFGDYCPGGKLAVTFPKAVGEIPLAFPFRPSADTNGKVRVAHALYPFGYGLSYTSFKYDNLAINHVSKGEQDSIVVSCSVTNTGSMDGDEVVQLYVKDDVSSLIRYEKELRGFERVHLRAGEKKTVTFSLGKKELGFFNRDNRFVVEPGAFTIMIGASSADIRLKAATNIGF